MYMYIPVLPIRSQETKLINQTSEEYVKLNWYLQTDCARIIFSDESPQLTIQICLLHANE